MHSQSMERWGHEHVFLGQNHSANEKKTWVVVALTAAMMVGEITAGIIFGSMALLADGWHMFTHAGALAIAAFAYRYARHHARDPRFAFGTGKLGDLAGFASAIILALIALLIAWESFVRLSNPITIRFDEAIAVAVVGLGVNLFCAWLLREAPHSHGQPSHDEHAAHDHGHEKSNTEQQRDYNLRSAYLHVIADAMTSVFAIAALLTGRIYGWLWMDPIVGVIGALVIARWSWGLMRDAGAILIDTVPDDNLAMAIRDRLNEDGDRVADLHLWRVGPGHNAAIVSVVSEPPASAEPL